MHRACYPGSNWSPQEQGHPSAPARDKAQVGNLQSGAPCELGRRSRGLQAEGEPGAGALPEINVLELTNCSRVLWHNTVETVLDAGSVTAQVSSKTTRFCFFHPPSPSSRKLLLHLLHVQSQSSIGKRRGPWGSTRPPGCGPAQQTSQSTRPDDPEIGCTNLHHGPMGEKYRAHGSANLSAPGGAGHAGSTMRVGVDPAGMTR